MNALRCLLKVLWCLCVALALVPAAQACTEAARPGPVALHAAAAEPHAAHAVAGAAVPPRGGDCSQACACVCTTACTTACTSAHAAAAAGGSLPALAETKPSRQHDPARPGRTAAPETPPPIA